MWHWQPRDHFHEDNLIIYDLKIIPCWFYPHRRCWYVLKAFEHLDLFHKQGGCMFVYSVMSTYRVHAVFAGSEYRHWWVDMWMKKFLPPQTSWVTIHPIYPIYDNPPINHERVFIFYKWYQRTPEEDLIICQKMHSNYSVAVYKLKKWKRRLFTLLNSDILKLSKRQKSSWCHKSTMIFAKNVVKCTIQCSKSLLEQWRGSQCHHSIFK